MTSIDSSQLVQVNVFMVLAASYAVMHTSHPLNRTHKIDDVPKPQPDEDFVVTFVNDMDTTIHVRTSVYLTCVSGHIRVCVSVWLLWSNVCSNMATLYHLTLAQIFFVGPNGERQVFVENMEPDTEVRCAHFVVTKTRKCMN